MTKETVIVNSNVIRNYYITVYRLVGFIRLVS